MMLNDFNKTCHGVVLWMDYQLTDELVSTTGLLKVRCVPGIHVAQEGKTSDTLQYVLILQMVWNSGHTVSVSHIGVLFIDL